MPKILNDLSQYMHEFSRLTSDNAVKGIRENENYAKYLVAIVELNEQVSKLYQPDENGAYPKVSNGELDSVREKYMDIYNSGNQLRLAIADMDLKNVPQYITVFRSIQTFLENMLADFHQINNSLDATNKSFAELLSHDTYRVDLGDKQLHTDKNMTDNQTPVSFADSTGNNVSGHFVKKEERSISRNEDFKAMERKIADEAFKDHPRFKAGMLALLKNDQFTNKASHPTFLENIFTDLAETENINEYFRIEVSSKLKEFLDEGETVESYLDEIAQDDSFTLCVMDFIKNYAPIRAKFDILENGKIDTLTNTEQRCAAMNAMAGALGASGSITQTVKAQAIENGKVVEGFFTQKGEGSHLHHLTENDPATRLDPEGKGKEIDNPTALKNIAQLQMLDFICGNMNRQRENMYYQFDEKDGQVFLTGVQGSENNYCFGAFEVKYHPPFSTYPRPRDLLVISEEMAEKVMAMTEESIQDLLKDYGLTEEEIDCAWDRTQHIQKMIREGKEYFAKHPDQKIAKEHLRVVKDDEWQQLYLSDLTYGIQFEDKSNARQFNYFTMVADLPNSVYYQQRDGVHDVNRKKFYEEKFPQLKKPADPEKIEGTRLDEMNAAGMCSNREKITELGKQLLEANSGFFIGSSEFKALMGSFQDVAGKVLKATEPMNVKDITALQQSYQNLMEKTNTYLEKKEHEKIALQQKGKEPSANMEKRMAFAKRLREFVSERLLKLDHQVDVADQQKLAVAKKLADGLEQGQNVVQANSGKNREMLEQSILNNAVFQTVTGAKTPEQMKELAGNSLENIKNTINQEGTKLMAASGQPSRQNSEPIAAPHAGPN